MIAFVLFVFVFILAVAVSILVHESIKPRNIRRHLTDDYSYAHFSGIDASNYMLTPSLLMTSPQRFTLTDGESLWIPKGWWHWVITTTPSVAVNFWMPEDSRTPTTPKVTTDFVQPPELLTAIEEFASGTIRIWNGTTDTFKTKTGMDPVDNEYAITLKGYVFDAAYESANEELLEVAKKHARIPPGADMNVWVSGGYHDTGLHYDDHDGVLVVLKGRKNITLYPPSDSKYLRPMSVVPKWATQIPEEIEYNLFRFNKRLPPTSLPSARLLYESIRNKAVVREIGKRRLEANTPLVWGCKLENGVLRWELYVYHFMLYDNTLANPGVERLWNPSGHPCIIHSIDLYDRPDPVGSDIHYYYKDSDGASLPIRGRGTTGPTTPEGEFRIDTADQVKRNFFALAAEIGFKRKDMERCVSLLSRYPCKHLSLWNKFKHQIYIQYLGISADDFLRFLREHDYPEYLVSHVEKEGYRDIVHEITVVYDLETLRPVRSGFYGIV